MFHYLYFVLFLLINNIWACSRRQPPTWSDTYTTRTILNVPSAEIEEPIDTWYRNSTNQSRTDYYNGMVKIYLLGNVEPYGEYYQSFPITLKLGENKRNYVNMNGYPNGIVRPQTILPDLQNFQCKGTEYIDNILTEKWEFSEITYKKQNVYTMYLYYKNDTKSNQKIPIPLKFNMQGRNVLDGNQYDHYYIRYISFNTEDISDDIFNIQLDINDIHNNTINETNLHLFNPIAEYIYPTQSVHVDHEFDSFKNIHQKEYDTHEEHSFRKDVFRQNMRFIHSINRQFKGYSLKINHLADRTDDELKMLRGLKLSEDHSNNGKPFLYDPSNYSDIPNEFDWRLYGAVTPVKDQSICGSCWSFAAIGAIEGAYFLHNDGYLINLSEQSLIDCSWEFNNYGCNGGRMSNAYDWVIKYGIPTENAYGGYLGVNGICHADQVDRIAKISGYVNVTINDINALKIAISKHGPVSVALNSKPKTFVFYSHGVYSDSECGNSYDEMDHTAIVVGYGTFLGQEYWLLKNSWSNHWGDNGYILMSTKNNTCGVLNVPQFVTF